jgi:uncharacterized protein (TIGR02453 family)
VVRGQQTPLRGTSVRPALDFIEAFAPRLEKISPHFRADPRPSGGSLFRIYRDTRFSKDKSPYKTNLGIHFRHDRAKDAHAPGYYLHIGPGEVFAGGGVGHPDTDAAKRIREAIVADPERWKRATRRGAFAKRLELGGDSLKRVPPWADADHPLAEDLKRKGRGQVHLSVSTWRQPLPPAASPERAALLEHLADRILGCADGRLRVGVDGLTASGDRYLVAERLYIEEVDPIRLVDVVIDNSRFDRPIVSGHRAQRVRLIYSYMGI